MYHHFVNEIELLDILDRQIPAANAWGSQVAAGLRFYRHYIVSSVNREHRQGVLADKVYLCLGAEVEDLL